MRPTPRRPSHPTATLAAVLAASALVLSDGSAASASAMIQVPAGSTLVVHGKGFGHGHGMSQYGAEGAARQGLTTQQIIRFYYPHTRAASWKGAVKVLITEDTDDNTTVVAQPKMSLKDLGSGRTWSMPTSGPAAKATRWRLWSGRSGVTRASYHTDTWHLWHTLTGDGELRRPGGITLVLPSGKVTYRGSLQSVTPANGPADHRITVNRLSMDSYVRGVIASEMPALWHPAALGAQAIAARTYAAYEASHTTNPRYDLCDSSQCQVYGGRSAEYASTNQAVVRTAGEIRTYRGRPAFTQFNASNGGWTADGGQPYLPAQQDPYDGWSGNPYTSWTTKVGASRVQKAFHVGTLEGITVDQRDGNGRWHGRVLQLTLTGSKRTATVSGDDFRSALGLRSTWFSLSVS